MSTQSTPCSDRRPQFFLGIDPGVSGAWCVIGAQPDEYNAEMAILGDLPIRHESGGVAKPYKTIDIKLLRRALEECCVNIAAACIERPLIFRKEAGMLIIGENFGLLKGFVEDFDGARLYFPRPNVWKKKMGIPGDKDKLMETTRRDFPEIREMLKRKKDHDRADAFHLARYARTAFFTRQPD